MNRNVPPAKKPEPGTLAASSVPAAAKPAVQRAPAPPEPTAEQLLLSAIGTRYQTSSAPRGRGADFGNARKWFRLPTQDDWVWRMKADPSVFSNILSDLFRETRAESERRAGQARIGRRPNVIEGSLGELWEMITPRYATESFPVAVKALMADMPVDDFCALTTITRDRFTAMCRGEGLEMFRLEAIARAFDVSPAYFMEWRSAYVLTLVEELLVAQPGLSIRYAKALSKAVAAPRKRPAAPAARVPAAVAS